MPKGAPSGVRIVWDESKERRLLLSYIMVATEANPGLKVNWTDVANRTGLGVTADASLQKFAKMKKQDADAFGPVDAKPKKQDADGFGSVNAAAITTPVKTKAPRPPKSVAKSTVKRVKIQNADDDEERQTPSKKAKVESATDDEN